MRNLEINKKLIKFVNYIGTAQVVDSQGNYTGEQLNTYSPIKLVKAHVSGAKGTSQIEAFGSDVSYDKTILFEKGEFARLKITENSVFFIDVKPKFNGTTPLYDYRVVRIAETINQVLVAVQKVETK